MGFLPNDYFKQGAGAKNTRETIREISPANNS